jgi:regulatory protein
MKKTYNTFEEERAGAREKALVLLADMDRTEKGLGDRLRRAGFSEEAAADAVAYVKGFGYVDDDRFAARYVELARSSKSRRRIRFDMMKRGFAQDTIDRAFEEAGWWDERPLIRSLSEKKARRLDMEDPKSRGKLAASLSRQGFAAEDIASVLRDMENRISP